MSRVGKSISYYLLILLYYSYNGRDTEPALGVLQWEHRQIVRWSCIREAFGRLFPNQRRLWSTYAIISCKIFQLNSIKLIKMILLKFFWFVEGAVSLRSRRGDFLEFSSLYENWPIFPRFPPPRQNHKSLSKLWIMLKFMKYVSTKCGPIVLQIV